MEKSGARGVSATGKSARSSRMRDQRPAHQGGKKIYVVAADSKTLGKDILEVFRQQVKAARRENMKVIGATDHVPSAKR